MKYRKKPVIIEAFQYNGNFKYAPDWVISALQKGVLFYGKYEGKPGELFIMTLEGNHHVSVCDFIIKGVQGELYPCKPDIFEQTYELVETKKEA